MPSHEKYYAFRNGSESIMTDKYFPQIDKEEWDRYKIKKEDELRILEEERWKNVTIDIIFEFEKKE